MYLLGFDVGSSSIKSSIGGCRIWSNHCYSEISTSRAFYECSTTRLCRARSKFLVAPCMPSVISSYSNMALQLADPDFSDRALAIGLWIVNHEQDVADGKMDQLIEELGEFFLSLGNRPVFLRIGYEFDGHVWNFYEREPFIAACKRID